ncbi:MAG TPA: exosortase A [Stellaceae bacterium]|nr:exosortase A [Stellaceae bacterium]
MIIPDVQHDPLLRATSRGAWLSSATLLGLAAAALIALFWPEARSAYDTWTGTTAYNHCFLIAPLSAYLIWQRRDVLERMLPNPSLLPLILLGPLTLVWIVAKNLSVVELEQLTIMTMFQVIAVTVLGWRAYRGLLVPFLYLFFLVPTGYFLVPWLQNLTASLAVKGLLLVGTPVYWDSTLIEVPSGWYRVAEACAGIRFLIASLAFGVFFAALLYRSIWRWVAFLSLSVIVPVIANGIRVFGTIELGEMSGSAAAVEADHIIYGWGFFSLVTLLLMAIGFRFAEDRKPAVARPLPRSTETPRWTRTVLAGALGILVSASGPAYIEWRGYGIPNIDFAAASEPGVMSPWHPLAKKRLDWEPIVHGADRSFRTDYSDGPNVVGRFVAIYQASPSGNYLVRSSNRIADPERWATVSRSSESIRINDQEETVTEERIAEGDRRMLVWSFYVIDGRVVAAPLAARLIQLRDLFGRADRVEAFFALAVDESNTENPRNVLQNFLAAMEPARTYLDSFGQ